MINGYSILANIAKRMLQLQDANTADLAADVYRHPTWTYKDTNLFELERKMIFGGNPLLLCFSTDLSEVGSYFTSDPMGVPVLATRDENGQVHAFLNACVHRGARLKEGCGKSGSLICPYHAWKYDLSGNLKRVFKEPLFGAVDKSAQRLTRLPVEEKYGLVFVGLTPDMRFSLDEYLGDLVPHLQMLNLDKKYPSKGEDMVVQANWKLALEAHLEAYHFGVLHDIQLGNDAVVFERFGPQKRHHLVAFTRAEHLQELRNVPESQWDLPLLLGPNLEYFIYPNVIINHIIDSIHMFHFYPGKIAGEHTTQYRSYQRQDLVASRRESDGLYDAMRRVVFDEDYPVVSKVQVNIDAGLRPFHIFGRNEPALTNAHQAFLRNVGLDPASTPRVRDSSMATLPRSMSADRVSALGYV